MNLSWSLHGFQRVHNSVLTIGVFDGLHCGHAAILQETIKRANLHGGRSVVITFEPHPKEILGDLPVKRLTTIEERIDYFKDFEIDELLIIEFTLKLSKCSPYDFYKNLYETIGIKEVVVGYDHIFGKDRQGGINELQNIGQKFGFSVIIVPPFVLNGKIVHSRAIRELLSNGNINQAEQLLGKPYSLRGKVIEGDGRGRKYGFPTANIQPLLQNKLIPAAGVYFVRIIIDSNIHFGMMNIGVRPTFKTDNQHSIEVHIFDYSNEIYNEIITVQFLRRLRDENRFMSENEFINQLNEDREKCIKYLEEINL